MTPVEEIEGHLRLVPFLTSVEGPVIAALAKVLAPRQFGPGEVLFREGDPGESMLIVAKGRLSVRIGDAEKEVAAIYPGEVVGEMACVDPAPRSATVVASKPTLVLELHRRTLELVRQKAPRAHVAIVSGVIGHLTRRVRETNGRIEQELSARSVGRPASPGGREGLPAKEAPAAPPQESQTRIDLRALKCFEEFTNDELKALLQAAPARTCAHGEALCREGDVGDSCFIVARGAVNVVRRMGGSDRILATMQAGTMVGQMALVDRAPRSATIVAHGETTVLELGRKAFEQLLAAASSAAVRFQNQIAVAGIRQLRAADTRFASLANELKAAELRRPAPVAPPPAASPQVASDAPPRPPAPPPAALRAPSGPVRPPSGAPRSSEEDSNDAALAYMKAALGEWGMDMKDLDSVQHVRVEGIMTAQEKRSRGGW